MAKVIRLSPTDISQGHPPWPPVPPILTTGDRRVFANGLPVLAVGDQYAPQIPAGFPIIPAHYPQAAFGSDNVFVHGKPIHRDGDSLNCGDAADNGSKNVFANGRGDGGPGGRKGDKDETTGYTVKVPVISYPSTIFINYVAIGDLGDQIVVNCPINQGPTDLYTPQVEEETNDLFKNYPGPPLTIRSGSDLPKYATPDKRRPIDIKNLSAKGFMPPGIKFDPITGRFSGQLDYVPAKRQYLVSVQCENIVGKSNVSTITFILQRKRFTCDGPNY